MEPILNATVKFNGIQPLAAIDSSQIIDKTTSKWLIVEQGIEIVNIYVNDNVI